MSRLDELFGEWPDEWTTPNLRGMGELMNQIEVLPSDLVQHYESLEHDLDSIIADECVFIAWEMRHGAEFDAAIAELAESSETGIELNATDAGI